MRKLILSNFGWLAFDGAFRLIGGVVVGIWVARYLGAESYGLLNYAMAFSAIFAAIAKLGIDRIVVRDLVKNREEKEKILGTVFVLKLLAAAVAFLMSVLLATIIEEADPKIIWIVSIISFAMFFNIADTLDIFYQAEIKSRSIVTVRTLSFLIFSLLKVLLILLEQDVYLFAVAYTLEIGFFALLLFLVSKCDGLSFKNWSFDKMICRSLLMDGWPLIVNSALVVIHTRLDQVMLGSMLGNESVGIFSVAVRLSDIWLFLPMMLIQSVNPYMIKLRDDDKNLYKSRIIQLFSLLFWSGFFVGAITLIFGESVVLLLYGNEYRWAYAPLVIIVWTGIFKAHGAAATIWMVAENNQLPRLMINVIAVPLNVILNILLIPVYGVVGAALASFISIGMSSWVFPLFFASTRPLTMDFIRSVNPMRLILVRD